MPIDPAPDVRKRMLSSVKRFFEEKMDEEIGDLKAGLYLDFCLKEIAPTAYNQGVADAGAYFQDKVVDLEGSCYEPELAYWDER